MQHEQIKDILAYFKGRPITQNVLTEYCNLKKHNLLTIGQYEDCVFQQIHDEHILAALPLIIAELAKIQYVPTFIADYEKRKINEENENVELKIAEIIEKQGFTYREVDIGTKNIAQILHGTMENAGRRVNNMCAVVFSTLAKEKFGEALAVEPLAQYYREKAKELGIKLKENESKENP